MKKLRTTLYYEFWTIDTPQVMVKLGTRTLGATSITTGIDSVPTMNIAIPLIDLPEEEITNIEAGVYAEPRLRRYNLIVYVQVEGKLKYRFNGVIDKAKIDYANYSVALTLSHKVARMREWPMPINYSVKNRAVSRIVDATGAALGYPNPPSNNPDGSPNFSMQSYEQQIFFKYADDGSADVPVTMTFGANNKLEALSEMLNNTENLHFTVDLSAEQDTILISSFTQELCSEVLVTPYVFEDDECEEKHDNFVTMLTEPTFNVDYTGHYNRAVVFCGDIQDGVNHLTLESYNGTSPTPGFPVGMYEYNFNLQPEAQYDDGGKKINNEKIYKDFEILAYSKNGNREFYVEDTEQLEKDNQIILTTTYNFSDLYPIPNLKQDIDEDGELEELVITDGDRAEIIRQAYLRAVRKLKAQRPQRAYQMNTTALPYGTYDGQKLHLLYSKKINVPDEQDECNGYTQRKIINIDECFYMTKRTITFDDALNEITTITLDAELRVKDISPTELELREAASEGTGELEAHYPDLGVISNRYKDINTYAPNYKNLLGTSVLPLPPGSGAVGD